MDLQGLYVVLLCGSFDTPCDKTRRPEWVFPKARQSTLEKNQGGSTSPSHNLATDKNKVDKQVNSCTNNILVEIKYMYNNY